VAVSRIAASAAARAERVRPGRDFAYLLSAFSAQTLGEGVVIAALPLLAARITTDPRLVSAVAVGQELPWLLLALPGGLIADRFDRRRLMIGAQAAQALMLIIIAVLLTSFGPTPIWTIAMLAFGLGTGDVLFTGANQAVIPAVVPAAALDIANGRSVTAETLGQQFLGPPLGAALFTFLLPLPFYLDASTYVLSLLLIARVRGGARFQPVPATETSRGSRRFLGMVSEATSGLRMVIRSPVLRAIMVLAAASNFCVEMGLSVLVLFAKESLHIGSRSYGILVAAMALGGIVGALASHRVVARVGARTVAIFVSICSAFSLLAIGLFGRQPVIVVALFWIWSADLALWNVMAQTVRQRLVPSEIMGRVTISIRMVCFGALPFGALAGGFVASALGLRATWVIGGILNLIIVLPFIPTLLHWPSTATSDVSANTSEDV
jgi:predicted MFS family arabinose efflux permease